MKPTARREQIVRQLKHSREPLTGRYLAEKYGISRQVIVGDIAALKASGVPILSTSEGYVYQKQQAAFGVYKFFHSNEQTEDELRLIVSLGGGVEDVMVRHRIYGELSAKLSIHNEDDIEFFMEHIRSGKSVPLMNVTSGYHYHMIVAQDEETLNEIVKALRSKGYLVE